MARVNTLPPAKPDDKVYETPLQIGARISSRAPVPEPKNTYPDLQNLPIDPAQAATAPYQKLGDVVTDKEELKSSKASAGTLPVETQASQQFKNKSAVYKLGKFFGKLFG